MKYLTIDTTTKVTALALGTVSSTGFHLIGEGFLHTGTTHSERLVPMLDYLLQAADWQLQDLDFIGAVRGPGSFTGIRIGLATAQGLAKVLRIPLLGLMSLDCLAWAAASFPGQGPKPEPCDNEPCDQKLGSLSLSPDVQERLVTTILDARKNEWYAACYGWNQAGQRRTVLAPCATEPTAWLKRLEELCRPVIFAGDALPGAAGLIRARLGDQAAILPPENALPRGAYAARECAYALERAAVEADSPVLSPEVQPYYIRLSEAETKYRSAPP